MLAVLSVLLVLVYVNVSPFGAEVVLRLTPSHECRQVRFSQSFTTSAELLGDGEGGTFQIPRLKMTTDEVTFDLQVPYKSFSTMEAKIRYKGDPEELKIGVLKKQARAGYRYGPIHNRSLNRLEWDRLTAHGVTLYQKNPVYAGVGEFLQDLPSLVAGQLRAENRTRVASYFYEPAQPAPVADMSGAGKSTTVDCTFRGEHVFYFYTPDGNAHFSFEKLDLNDSKGPDDLCIYLSDTAGKKYPSLFVPDDGDESDTRVPSSPRRVEWSPQGLQPGAYRLSFSCENDVLFRKVKSSNKYFCSADRVFLADNSIYRVGPSKPAVLYSDATDLTVQVWNPEAVQTVTVNDSITMPLTRPSTPIRTMLAPGMKTIKTETGSIILDAPGSFFAFKEGSLFDPLPLKTLDYRRRHSPSTYDYVVTGYRRPRERGGWLEQSVSLDIEECGPIDNVASFSILAPGLAAEKREVVIDLLEITLKR